MADAYPDLYPIFAKREFTHNKIKQLNRNPLLYGTVGADGLKPVIQRNQVMVWWVSRAQWPTRCYGVEWYEEYKATFK